MAIKASGPLKFSDITNEFGRPKNSNLGAFRVSKTVGSLSNLPLDTGIPGPGQPISFSDFYSKKLNIVVDFFSGPAAQRINARREYDNDGPVVVIGGFRGRPKNTGGKKVIIHVNKIIGSNSNDRNNVALKTGNWDQGTTLVTIIGPNGKLIFAGGDGGSGGSGSAPGQNGTQGTSAFGIQYSTTVVNQGLIFGGRGGGGGGGGSQYNRCARNQRRCGGPNRINLKGGGGAGGRGFPIGSGGLGGSIKNSDHESKVVPALKFDGTDGNPNTSGEKGTGIFGNGTSEGYNGTSGNGGEREQSGQSGTTQNNKGSSGAGGQGGQRGYAIIVAHDANLISYNDNGGATGGEILDPGNLF